MDDNAPLTIAGQISLTGQGRTTTIEQEEAAMLYTVSSLVGASFVGIWIMMIRDLREVTAKFREAERGQAVIRTLKYAARRETPR